MGNMLSCVSTFLVMGEKISVWAISTVFVCCIVITIITILGLGIGLGYNYCFVDMQTRYRYIPAHYVYPGSPYWPPRDPARAEIPGQGLVTIPPLSFDEPNKSLFLRLFNDTEHVTTNDTMIYTSYAPENTTDTETFSTTETSSESETTLTSYDQTVTSESESSSTITGSELDVSVSTTVIEEYTDTELDSEKSKSTVTDTSESDNESSRTTNLEGTYSSITPITLETDTNATSTTLEPDYSEFTFDSDKVWHYNIENKTTKYTHSSSDYETTDTRVVETSSTDTGSKYGYYSNEGESSNRIAFTFEFENVAESNSTTDETSEFENNTNAAESSTIAWTYEYENITYVAESNSTADVTSEFDYNTYAGAAEKRTKATSFEFKNGTYVAKIRTTGILSESDYNTNAAESSTVVWTYEFENMTYVTEINSTADVTSEFGYNTKAVEKSTTSEFDNNITTTILDSNNTFSNLEQEYSDTYETLHSNSNTTPIISRKMGSYETRREFTSSEDTTNYNETSSEPIFVTNIDGDYNYSSHSKPSDYESLGDYITPVYPDYISESSDNSSSTKSENDLSETTFEAVVFHKKHSTVRPFDYKTSRSKILYKDAENTRPSKASNVLNLALSNLKTKQSERRRINRKNTSKIPKVDSDSYVQPEEVNPELKPKLVVPISNPDLMRLISKLKSTGKNYTLHIASAA